MNSFGRLFRVTIFGESHGSAVGITIDGCAPGIPLSEDDFTPDLDRRKGGSQKGTTPRKEDDKPIFLSGLFNNHTTGSPLTIIFENNNTRSADYEKQRAILRPGHADFIAGKKYDGYEDFRGGGHFSGRLTVGLVAAGVVAKKMLSHLSAEKLAITAFVKEIGGETDLELGLQKAIDAKDSVGGIVECQVTNVPLALGEPFFDSFESLLSHIVFAIPAVRGIEFGTGFAAARMFGIDHNDAFIEKPVKRLLIMPVVLPVAYLMVTTYSFALPLSPPPLHPRSKAVTILKTGRSKSFPSKAATICALPCGCRRCWKRLPPLC